ADDEYRSGRGTGRLGGDPIGPICGPSRFHLRFTAIICHAGHELPAGALCQSCGRTKSHAIDAIPARRYRGRAPSIKSRGVPDHDVSLAQARVAELVDAHDSKSCSARSVGSIPSTGTKPSLLRSFGWQLIESK